MAFRAGLPGGIMNRFVALLAGAAALGLASASAEAQQTPGWYIGIQGGWTHLNSASNTFANPITTGGVAVPFTSTANEGFNGGGTIGFEFPSGIRLEAEGTYRQNTFNTVSSPFFGGATAPLGGRESSIALMGNGLYDFMPYSRWTPYLGAGAGAARLNVHNLNAVGLFGGSASDWEFAYQGIAGVKFAATPQVSISLDYRYFATTSPTFAIAGGTATGQYGTHNVMASIAYHFGAPPPPPPAPAPQPAPVAQPAPPPPPAAHTFIVFFEFDRATLTPEGLQVIQNASDAFRQTGSASVQIAGYTDLAGTQRYNLGLSKRRADAVRAQLVRDGVPDKVIQESWHGKENPRVPTPDGVREPQNRRVEIML